LGKFRSEPLVIAAHENPRLPDLGPEHRLGREVARACVECHGPQLQGGGPAQAPDLMIAASYDPADLERLLRTGKAAGDRELRLMSASSRIRFAALTDAEIVALHGYLKARAERVANGVATKALPKP
jgi:mono/diheme cytochrome c family protein